MTEQRVSDLLGGGDDEDDEPHLLTRPTEVGRVAQPSYGDVALLHRRDGATETAYTRHCTDGTVQLKQQALGIGPTALRN